MSIKERYIILLVFMMISTVTYGNDLSFEQKAELDQIIINILGTSSVYNIGYGEWGKDINYYHITILFYAESYNNKNNNDYEIQYTLLPELSKLLNIENIQIRTAYLFKILIKNASSYDDNDYEIIKKDIWEKTKFVFWLDSIVESKSNSFFAKGFFYDKCFGYLSNLENEWLLNNGLKKILELFIEYFGDNIVMLFENENGV
jgi:hypothetical protein